MVLNLHYLQLISKNNRPSFPAISILQFHNVTSGILEEIVSGKTNDNDKIPNFGLSISYTPDPAAQENSVWFCFT